jgi:hypothetical protein
MPAFASHASRCGLAIYAHSSDADLITSTRTRVHWTKGQPRTPGILLSPHSTAGSIPLRLITALASGASRNAISSCPAFS